MGYQFRRVAFPMAQSLLKYQVEVGPIHNICHKQSLIEYRPGDY